MRGMSVASSPIPMMWGIIYICFLRPLPDSNGSSRHMGRRSCARRWNTGPTTSLPRARGRWGPAERVSRCAGGRGLAALVPQVAVDALAAEFGSRSGDLVAVIGPAISAARYEVGAGVRVRFEQAGCTTEQVARWFTPAARPDHWNFDGRLAA